jgi:hypothetical protein
MVKRSMFTEYHQRYATCRFTLTDDGILFMQLPPSVWRP